jgi:large subunit ribosomal protein L20
MSRVKRGVASSKRRNYLLKRAKGFKGKGGNIFRLAKQRLFKAERNAYISRRLRKRDFRRLWISRINGALDAVGSELSYSKFIYLLNKSDLKLNRKMLSEIAIVDIEAFKKIVSQVAGAKSTTESKKVLTKDIEDKTSVKVSAKNLKEDNSVSNKVSEKLSNEVEDTKVKKVEDEVSQTTITKEVIKEETTTKVVLINEPQSAKSDDLKVVEGIGPAIEKLLHATGILTYSDLADADYEKLKEILKDGGSNFSIHDPLNWAKQSALAAAGKFDELKTLKEELVNGK